MTSPDTPHAFTPYDPARRGPGVYEHRGMDCERHGSGPHWRPKGSAAPYICVACTLEAQASNPVAATRDTDPAPAPTADPSETERLEREIARLAGEVKLLNSELAEVLAAHRDCLRKLAEAQRGDKSQ